MFDPIKILELKIRCVLSSAGQVERKKEITWQIKKKTKKQNVILNGHRNAKMMTIQVSRTIHVRKVFFFCCVFFFLKDDDRPQVYTQLMPFFCFFL